MDILLPNTLCELLENPLCFLDFVQKRIRRLHKIELKIEVDFDDVCVIHWLLL